MDPNNLPPLNTSQVISVVVYMTTISVLAHVLTVRCRIQLLWDIVRGRETWARICGVAIFALSWLFVFSAALLVLGVGLVPGNLQICWILTLLCTVLYALIKVFIYCFLIEKVYLVWSAGLETGRWQSTLWRICMCAIVLYIGCFAFMITVRWAKLDDAGQCVVGINREGPATGLSFDIVLTVAMTFMFVYPLRKNAGMSPRLRKTATRAMIAAILTMSSAAVNSAFLLISSGMVGWTCLILCACDVTTNALVIYFVTYGNDSTSMNSPTTSTAPEQQNLSTLMIPTMGPGVLTQLAVADEYDPEKYPVEDPTYSNDKTHEATKPEDWADSHTSQEMPSPVRIILPPSPKQFNFSPPTPTTSLTPSLEEGFGSQREAEGNVTHDSNTDVPLHK